jgi:putative transposase
MARPLRLEFPGAIYHITSRGNARGDIYLDTNDRNGFLSILGEICAHYNWCCYAFCLMTNHYHLVLETAEANLSRGMRQLNGLYSQGFNRKHHRTGHLFQGRYQAIHVDKDSYFLEVIRYVVLNPVRAGMTKTAGQYPWSNYRMIIGKASAPAWLNPALVLNHYGSRTADAKKHFVEFVKAGAKQGQIWDNLRQQIYLGEEAFIESVHLKSGLDAELPEIPRIQARKPGLSIDAYVAQTGNRNEAIREAYKSGTYTQKELSVYFGLHYSTVSKILS